MSYRNLWGDIMTKVKTIKKEATLYLCSICGKEFYYEYMAEACIKKHEWSKCKHKNVKYSINDEDHETYSSIEIHKCCTDCERLLGYVSISAIEEKDWKKLYNKYQPEYGKDFIKTTT